MRPFSSLPSRSALLLLALGLLACTLAACDSDGSDNQEPQAAFSLTPDDPAATRPIQFTDESRDPDGEIATWNWQFGNGDTSEEQNPTYTYAEPGDYDVTLTVADDEGEMSMDTTRQITVADLGPLRAAQDGTWTWIPFAGSSCRDGSNTGIGVRVRSESDQLFIYLQGGGACFNSVFCNLNRSSYDESDFDAFHADGGGGQAGIFDTGNTANPVRDWNAIYVPYCTGDVHAGSNPSATVPGVDAPQAFVGHENMELYLDAAKMYFRHDLSDVLLTGASAGGFGALVNFNGVAQRFNGADTYLLDDSGPIFYDDNVLAPEQQAMFVDLWNLEDSLPSDADALLQPDGLANVYAYYADKYPQSTFGLASHLEDSVIRLFFGASTGGITGPEYTDGLLDLNQQAPAAWGTYYAPSDAHTFIGGQRFYNTTVEGVALTDWVGDLLQGNVSDVAPPVETRPPVARR